MTKQHHDMKTIAIDLIASCARQTGVNGRFDYKVHHQCAGNQRLRTGAARKARLCRHAPHPRSIRLACEKGLGGRITSPWSALS